MQAQIQVQIHTQIQIQIIQRQKTQEGRSPFDKNPLSACPMMIVKYSGQAPRPFPHPFHGMSAHEMSGHDP